MIHPPRPCQPVQRAPGRDCTHSPPSLPRANSHGVPVASATAAGSPARLPPRLWKPGHVPPLPDCTHMVSSVPRAKTHTVPFPVAATLGSEFVTPPSECHPLHDDPERDFPPPAAPLAPRPRPGRPRPLRFVPSNPFKYGRPSAPRATPAGCPPNATADALAGSTAGGGGGGGGGATQLAVWFAVALSTAPDGSQPMFRAYGGGDVTIRHPIGPTTGIPALHCAHREQGQGALR